MFKTFFWFNGVGQFAQLPQDRNFPQAHSLSLSIYLSNYLTRFFLFLSLKVCFSNLQSPQHNIFPFSFCFLPICNVCTSFTQAAVAPYVRYCVSHLLYLPRQVRHQFISLTISVSTWPNKSLFLFYFSLSVSVYVASVCLNFCRISIPLSRSLVANRNLFLNLLFRFSHRKKTNIFGPLYLSARVRGRGHHPEARRPQGGGFEIRCRNKLRLIFCTFKWLFLLRFEPLLLQKIKRDSLVLIYCH